MDPKKQGFWPRVNCSQMNYQILGLHPLTVSQNLGVILGGVHKLRLREEVGSSDRLWVTMHPAQPDRIF